MTDALAANTTALVERYTTAYRAAQEIARRTVKVQYVFEIYLEDQTHGGKRVGTGDVRFRTVQPLCPREPSAMHTILVEQTAEMRKAFQNGSLCELRCRMTVQLSGLEDPAEHCFESNPARTSRHGGDTGTTQHSFKFVDTTQDDPAETWTLIAMADARSPLVIQRAEFDLDVRDHLTLYGLLVDEAADALVDRVLGLLPDADATARKRLRTE